VTESQVFSYLYLYLYLYLSVVRLACYLGVTNESRWYLGNGQQRSYTVTFSNRRLAALHILRFAELTSSFGMRDGVVLDNMISYRVTDGARFDVLTRTLPPSPSVIASGSTRGSNSPHCLVQ
jgi:hypothetical protein